MSYFTMKTRKRRRWIILFAAFGTIIVPSLVFCAWVYKTKSRHTVATAPRNLNTKLLAAVKANDTEAAKTLLAQGADPNIRDVPQQTEVGSHTIDRKDSHKRTLLEMAIGLNSEVFVESERAPDIENAPLVKALLDAGARTEDSSDRHRTPLMKAVNMDELRTVQLLLDHGANPLARDDQGKLPIHFMRCETDTELKIADLLLKRGTDINAADDQGWTPLTGCFTEGESNIPMTQFLIAHGANVNTQTIEGDSVLMDAASMGDRNAMKLLVEHGADVDCHNKKGDTALSLAKNANATECIRLLKAAGATR